MISNLKKDVPSKLFEDFSIFSGSMNALLDLLSNILESPGQGREMMTVMTPNPEQIVLAAKNGEFKAALQAADILLPDGAGLVWAMNRRVAAANRVRRIAGREVFHALLEIAVQKKYRIFLLGGKQGSAEAIIANRQSIVAAFYDGPKESDSLQQIVLYRPDILFIAYGAPAQELWLTRNKQALSDAGIRLAMVVGGAFEYECGKVLPVPEFIVRLHLEWLFRLWQEPSRWNRQLKGLEFFLKQIVPH